jgi:outer membrane protein TolC
LRKILTFNKHNIKLHQNLFKLIKERNKLGVIDNSEVIIYEAQLFNILLKKMQIKTELFKAEQEYQHIIGSLDFDLTLSKLTIDNFPINQVDLLKEALANNPNLKQYKYKIEALKQTLKQRKGDLAPQVNFVADISKQESVTYLDNRDLRTESFSLNITVPLFQKGREYVNLKKARKELLFAQHEYNKNVNDIAKDIKKTYREYNFYYEMINENKILINFTANKISGLTEKIKVGMGDRLDLLTAQLELNSLQEQQLNNQISYQQSYYKILLFLNKLTKENV